MLQTDNYDTIKEKLYAFEHVNKLLDQHKYSSLNGFYKNNNASPFNKVYQSYKVQ